MLKPKLKNPKKMQIQRKVKQKRKDSFQDFRQRRKIKEVRVKRIVKLVQKKLWLKTKK